jgi:hypothetical protein
LVPWPHVVGSSANAGDARSATAATPNNERRMRHLLQGLQIADL